MSPDEKLEALKTFAPLVEGHDRQSAYRLYKIGVPEVLRYRKAFFAVRLQDLGYLYIDGVWRDTNEGGSR